MGLMGKDSTGILLEVLGQSTYTHTRRTQYPQHRTSFSKLDYCTRVDLICKYHDSPPFRCECECEDEGGTISANLQH
jgi:hypothetical protein